MLPRFASLLFAVSLSQQQSVEAHCDINDHPVFENAEDVKWNSDKGEVSCHKDFIYVGKQPAAQCVKGKWLQNGKCLQYLWLSPSNKDFRLPEPLIAGQEICLSVDTVRVKRHTISFRDGANNVILFQFDIENKTVHANTYHYGFMIFGRKHVYFENLCTAMQAGKVFMKFRFHRDRTIELVVNGFHKYIYSSGYKLHDVRYLSTTLVILALDLVCDRQKTNFCKEELAPSLDNGAFTWRKTQDRLEGSAVCNNKLTLIKKSNSISHCDRNEGWVMSGEHCVSLINVGNEVEDKEQITAPTPLTSGDVVTMAVVIRDNDSFVDLKGKDKVYRFVISKENQTMFPDTIGNKIVSPSTLVLTPNAKLNSTLFLQFCLVNNNTIKVRVNGGNSSAEFHSDKPLESIVGVETNQEILLVNFQNDLRASNVCTENIAPSFYDGVIEWKKVDTGLKGEIRCPTDYDCFPLDGCSAECNVKTGWRIDAVCKRYAWTSGPFAANKVFLLPQAIRDEQEIVLSANTVGDRRHVISFSDGASNRIQFQFDLDKGTALANTYVNGSWGKQTDFKTLWTVKPNGKMFMKIKFHKDKDIELVINGFYRYVYSSGYNIQDLKDVSASLDIMAIDLVGDRHRTNFCKEELAPSLDNGDFTWRKTQDRLEGSAVCNNKLTLIKKSNSISHCDRNEGWVMSGEHCVSLINVGNEVEDKEQITAPTPLTSGDVVTMAVVIRDNDSFVDLKGKDKVYRFVISKENQTMFPDTIGNKIVSPSTLVLTPNAKLNSTLFLQFCLVNNNTIKVRVNGGNSSAEFHSDKPLESIVGVETNQEILLVSFQNDLRASNVCTENIAPSFYDGVIEWKKVDTGLKGEIRCPTDYDCFPLDGCSAECNVKTGWRIDAVCKRYAWTSGPFAANKVFLLPQAIRDEQEIVLSANTVGDRRHVISFSDGASNRIQFQFDLDKGTALANTYVNGSWGKQTDFKTLWTVKPNGKMFMKIKFHKDKDIELVINGFYRYVYSSGYNIQDLKDVSASLDIMAIDLVGDRHRTNFCKEELAPSLDNGDFTWRKTQDRLEGSAVCNKGFFLINRGNSTSHCDREAGWVMSQQCVSLRPMESPMVVCSSLTGRLFNDKCKDGFSLNTPDKRPIEDYVCEENHIPKVLNGKVLSRRNGSVLIGDVICNTSFVRNTSKSSLVVCSSLTGWLFDDVCKDGFSVNTPEKEVPTPGKISTPTPLTSGDVVTMAVVIRDNDSFVDLKGKDKVYRFVISKENQTMFPDTMGNKIVSPSTLVLTPNAKLNSTLFLQFCLVNNHTIKVRVNGGNSSAEFHSDKPLESIVGVETNQEILLVSFQNDLRASSVCTENIAPSFYDGVIEWKKVDTGLKGEIRCPTDYDCFPLDGCSAECNVKTGWRIDAVCKRYAWTSGPFAENMVFPLPQAIRDEQEIVLSANTVGDRRHVISFSDGATKRIQFQFDFDNGTALANTYVNGSWGKQTDFKSLWTVKPNGKMFMKIKFHKDKDIELVINGFYRYVYSSGYNIQDLKDVSTSLDIMAIELVGDRHRTNFCKEELAPSLDNGAFTWRKTQDRLEGSAVCNKGFFLINRGNSTSHCDREAGWVMSQQCVSQHSVERPIEDYVCEENNIPKVLNGKVLPRRNGSVLIGDVICNTRFVRNTSKSSLVVCSSLTGWLFDDVCKEVPTPGKISTPTPLTSGDVVTMAVVIRDNDSFVDLKGKDKVYRFVISKENQTMFPDTMGNKIVSPSTLVLTPNAKLNSTLFLQFCLVNNHTIKVRVNGRNSSAEFHSDKPLESIVRVETNQEILFVSFQNDLRASNVCTENIAPSFYDGVIEWKKVDTGLKGEIRCPTDYDCFPLDGCSAECNVKTGWRIDAVCKRYAWTSGPFAANEVFLLPHAIRDEQEIVLSANTVGDRRHVILFSDGATNQIQFQFDLNKGTALANTYVNGSWGKQTDFKSLWTVKPNGKVFMKIKFHKDKDIELVINGFYRYVYSSGYNIQDLKDVSTSLYILAIDLVGDRHRTNFCKEEFAPSLDNSDLAWRKTQDRLEGSAVCNKGFFLINRGNSTSHCDREAGWVMSQQCVSRLSVERFGKGYPFPSVISSGYEICLSANTTTEERPHLSFTNGKDVLFLFKIHHERKLVAKSAVDGDRRQKMKILTSWLINPNEIVFIKVKVLSDNQMQLLINGIESWTVYSFRHSVKNIKYFKTSLTVLEIDLTCNQHNTNFCREDLAPSMANGALVLKRMNNRIEGNVTCNEGFMLTSLINGNVHCDLHEGWVVSRQCNSRI